ncbi:Ribosomal RNA small subunit methyltransferase E [hydrothermal vent metagenome]|uniref:16S rRNA (uracil(1498)-N(3))-methyltransferase n=1 Tax=hydrothermal vent metagenome TaxID=652676 RepID=A0A1W1BYN9_9ZZZZ
MQYLYHKDAATPSLQLTGDEHRYIFKVRRAKVGDTINLRNLKDQILYSYRVIDIDKKSAILHLASQRELIIKAKRSLHIGWCKIDPKSIDKMLPTLNEIGVEKITIIDCQRSQNSFRVDFERAKKILLNSSQQCGRSSMMRLEQSASLERFIADYPQSYMLNFSENIISDYSHIETIIVGAEGGFTDVESRLIESEHIVALETPLILKSESAVAVIASKIVL